jgi:hypothetical protein
MVAAAQVTNPSMTYEAWKAQAVSYAWTTNLLPEDCIEDDRFQPAYSTGDTPEQAVDDHCQRYDINKVGPWGTI